MYAELSGSSALQHVVTDMESEVSTDLSRLRAALRQSDHTSIVKHAAALVCADVLLFH